MKGFRFIICVFLITFSALASDRSKLLRPDERLAPDCAFASVKYEYDRAQAVFVGKVMSVKEIGDTKIYELRVEKYWKGVKSRKIKITAGKNMRYEPHYQLGTSYLIYAALNNKGELRVGRCTRGFAIEFAKEDLKVLGKGKRMR